VRDAESSEDEGEGSWEKMQIRKAITGQQVGLFISHTDYSVLVPYCVARFSEIGN
jgi:hypothetical protein